MARNKTNLGKRFIGLLVILTILLTALYLTNPDEVTFKDFLKYRLRKEASRQDKVSGAIMDILAGPIASVSQLTSERKDYYFFSVYSVTVFDEEEKFIGVFNRFIKTGSSRP